jgi:hypothetical protein
VQAFLNAMPGAALTAFRPSLQKLGGVDGNVIIFEELMDWGHGSVDMARLL